MVYSYGNNLAFEIIDGKTIKFNCSKKFNKKCPQNKFSLFTFSFLKLIPEKI